ncbi:MAG: indolepyruvate ferredoxin oxidoreductase subunit alpha [Candidatus Heimdallarchaeota archaeon]|nr:indolepyruvate ferredoxin oxidoreductase subunit alpha [Candidatus Heimdallarchaeota archaeon]
MKQLLLAEGETITGDMSIMFLKGSLESGISYTAGYPGAPTSNVLDLLGDAQDKILNKYGIYFEASTNEAAAATKMYLSINEKLRGFVNWKVVGTNVASDVMLHVASSGVKGGAVILIGEDEECISTTVKMKSQIYGEGFFLPVIDSIGDATNFIEMTRLSYKLSEYCNQPVMFLFRSHTGNMWGSAKVKNNQQSEISMNNKAKEFNPDLSRVSIPPASVLLFKEKYEDRLPKAIEFIRDNKMNKVFKGEQTSKIGIITHGGIYNYVITTMHDLGLASLTGRVAVDLLALNVTFPLVPEELIQFVEGKDKIFVIEQGTPNFIEKELKTLLFDLGKTVEVYGKISSRHKNGYIPEVDILTPEVLIGPIANFFLSETPINGQAKFIEKVLIEHENHREILVNDIMENLIVRGPTFCSGCPERPVFANIKRVEEELGERFVRLIDIGCYTMAKLAPFNLSDSCTGMGSSLDTAMGMTNLYDKHVVAVFGDGTLFHSGLRNFDNAVHNNLNQIYDQTGSEKGKTSVLLFILLNYHTAMTGDQENPQTLFEFHQGKNNRKGKNLRGEAVERLNLEKVLKTHGANWVKTVPSYEMGKMKKTIHEALKKPGLKVIISDGECALEKTRHESKYRAELLSKGKRWMDPGTQVDPKLCAGCWPCTEYIGCPSEGKIDSPNPLKKGTIREMDSSCLGCGVCSSVTQEFGLCPSTYNYYTVSNPSILERARHKMGKFGIKILKKL